MEYCKGVGSSMAIVSKLKLSSECGPKLKSSQMAWLHAGRSGSGCIHQLCKILITDGPECNLHLVQEVIQGQYNLGMWTIPGSVQLLLTHRGQMTVRKRKPRPTCQATEMTFFSETSSQTCTYPDCLQHLELPCRGQDGQCRNVSWVLGVGLAR
jgi:hypothetical protein